MIRSRLGLKALGMCALVIGLMAVWAGSAQAELTGGKWTYEPSAGVVKTFEGTLAEPEVSGKLEKETTAVLHTKVLGGTSLLYECKAVSVIGGKLKAELNKEKVLVSNGEVLGELTFTGCEAFLGGALSKNCNPVGETIKTKKIKAFMLLHKLPENAKKEIITDKILVAEPEEGTTFATVESTELCSIGSKVPIGGKFAIQDPAPTTQSVNHLISEFPALTHLFVISDTVEHAANILGSAEAFLLAPHLGLKWAGVWN
jgi:hypothetical protein